MLNQAWPFLVSRNQSIDYKTVVAPNFISEVKIRSLLLKASDDDSFEDGKVGIRLIQGSKAGDFTIVFRVAKARRRNIGESGDDILKDSFGREIYVIEGLVFQEKPNEILGKIRQIHLDQTHEELKDQYREFWNEDKISDSYSISLREDVSSPSIQLEELKPFWITTNSQLPNAVENRKSASKPAKNKMRLSILIISVIAVLLLLIIFRNIIGDSTSKFAGLENCRYVTQIAQISFENNEKDGSIPLKKLMNEHPKAWIFLEGILNVKLDNNHNFELANPKKTQQNYSILQPTLTQNNGKLYMKYHPINASIALLRNQAVTNSKLEATIVEIVQPQASSQCIILEAS